MPCDLRRCSSVACPSSQKVRSFSGSASSSPGAAHDVGVVEVGESLGEASQVGDRDLDWCGNSLASA